MSGDRPGDFFDLGPEIEAATEAGRWRTPRIAPAGLVDLCSNDYFGLGQWALEPTARAGAGASLLVSGYTEAHAAAEHAIAEWLGRPSTTLFTSGYAANLGAVQALVGRGDVVVSDALNHASIVDGCRLSRAEVVVVPHLDVEAVADALAAHPGRRRLVVTESYFSMDADGPDLARLRATCDAHGAALMVDEAHALGCFGPSGRGRCAEAGVEPDVLVGTFGKAIGLQGAFVSGSDVLRQWLWNRARSLVFSTAMSPAVAADVPRRVAWLRDAGANRARLLQLGQMLRGRLRGGGCDVRGFGHVVPVVFGEVRTTLRAAEVLATAGFFAPPIRPPTVPEGEARIRLTLRSTLDDATVSAVAEHLSCFT